MAMCLSLALAMVPPSLLRDAPSANLSREGAAAERSGAARERRMGAHRFFVNVGAPARPRWHDHLALLDDRRMGQEVTLPRHIVDLEFHDPVVRNRGAKMRAHQGREVAAEIMRRDIDLVS